MLPERHIQMSSWNERCKPTRHSGIYKTPTGYRVRVRAMDPRTGTLKERNQEYEGITQDEAIVKQAEMRLEILSGGRGEAQRRGRDARYATCLCARKRET